MDLDKTTNQQSAVNPSFLSSVQDLLQMQITLSPEEHKLVLDHREAKRQREASVVSDINQAVADSLHGHLSQDWRTWPGTNRIANVVFNRLKQAGLFKL